MAYVESLENQLDRFLPKTSEKCGLFACTPGKIWLVLALLSVVGSVNYGWKAFLTTVFWEVIIGWGVAWLCRGCSYGWLWAFLIIFAGIPLAFAAAVILFGCCNEVID